MSIGMWHKEAWARTFIRTYVPVSTNSLWLGCVVDIKYGITYLNNIYNINININIDRQPWLVT